MTFPVFLAAKYLKPKRSLTSVITCVSVTGVMLGVAIVVIVRAVMTGFGDMWQEKILNFKPHLTVLARSGVVISDDDRLVPEFERIPGVSCVSPEIDTRVLLACEGRVSAPMLLGVEAERMKKAFHLGEPYMGRYDLDGDSIVLGIDLAESLGAYVGAKVTVYSPKTLVSRDEVVLPVKWTVTGIFSTGQRDYDSGYAVASLYNVRELMALDSGVYAIHIKTDSPADHEAFGRIAEAVRATAPNRRVITWQEADRGIFNALAVEKNMMALLLMFITVVAMFCVMNTLLVLTVQKTSEIGLLKALGFSPLEIMGAFVGHGFVQCLAGIVLGLGLAFAILANLQNLVELLARFGLEVFPKAIYGLDAIPYRIVTADVVWTVVAVVVFGALASLIPATVAVSKNPVEALGK